MPGLTVLLSLDNANYQAEKDGTDDPVLMEVVPFISGLLLGNDQMTRTWFSVFIRISQKGSKDKDQPV